MTDPNALDGQLSGETISVKLSACNAEQLEQVHALLKRQQAGLAERKQALAVQIEALKADARRLGAQLDKHTADIQVVTELMTPSQRKQRLAAMGADGPTVAEVLAGPGRMDAVASGVVLEAQAKA
jgi:DNA-binding protein H-NS